MNRLRAWDWAFIACLYVFGAGALAANTVSLPAAGEERVVMFAPGASAIQSLHAAQQMGAELVSIGATPNILILSFTENVSLPQLWQNGALLSFDPVALAGCNGDPDQLAQVASAFAQSNGGQDG